VKFEAGRYPVRALSPWYVVQPCPAEDVAVVLEDLELVDDAVVGDAELLEGFELVEVELELCEAPGWGGSTK